MTVAQQFWQATLYDHANYNPSGGRQQDYHSDNSPCDGFINTVDWIGSWMNDRTSSATMPPACINIRFWEDIDTWGDSDDCGNPCPYVGDFINDRASSFAIL